LDTIGVAYGNAPASIRCGAVSVGVLPTIAPYLLPGVMAEFAKRFPGVEMVVQEDTTAGLIKLVHGYEIDFALASQPMQDKRLEIAELFSEELFRHVMTIRCYDNSLA